MNDPMTHILTAITAVLEESGREVANPIHSETNLRNDLDLDSLDLAVLAVKIEAETGVDVFAKGVVRTVGDIVERLS